jgi:hypothetical protein
MQRVILFFVLIGIQVFTLKTFAQVSENWVQRFTSDSTRDETVNDMFVDAQGNVYITGSQKGPYQSQLEAVTVKYNSNGVQQWIQNYHAPSNNGAFGRAIHVDVNGFVYVTGENAIISGGANEALIIKYNSTGTQLWSYRFQYVNQSYAGGFDIITDLIGNVYVTGEYGNGGNNIFLIKFDPSGTLVGQTFYNSSSEGGRRIALDGAGKIIIGGYIQDNDSSSFIALKYEQNLDLVWTSRLGQNIGNQNVIDMAIDNNSNIILAGTSNLDYQIVKINPAGAVQWSKLYNSTSGWDRCKGVVKDDLGNIYITGETGALGFPLTYKITTIKYSPDGNEIWLNEFGDSAGTDGYTGYDIAIDNLANVYIIGQRYSNLDITTIKYNTAGSLQWTINYNGLSNSQDVPVAVGVDPNGNVFSTGNSLDFTTGYDIAIIKYVQMPTSIEEEGNFISSFTLKQNYPNPFNPSTKISWQSSVSSWQTLKVYDVLGNEIATLVDEYKPAGNYEVDFNAIALSNGVYFYKLQSGDFVEIKKMTFLK